MALARICRVGRGVSILPVDLIDDNVIDDTRPKVLYCIWLICKQ